MLQSPRPGALRAGRGLDRAAPAEADKSAREQQGLFDGLMAAATEFAGGTLSDDVAVIAVSLVEKVAAAD